MGAADEAFPSPEPATPVSASEVAEKEAWVVMELSFLVEVILG